MLNLATYPGSGPDLPTALQRATLHATREIVGDPVFGPRRQIVHLATSTFQALDGIYHHMITVLYRELDS